MPLFSRDRSIRACLPQNIQADPFWPRPRVLVELRDSLAPPVRHRTTFRLAFKRKSLLSPLHPRPAQEASTTRFFLESSHLSPFLSLFHLMIPQGSHVSLITLPLKPSFDVGPPASFPRFSPYLVQELPAGLLSHRGRSQETNPNLEVYLVHPVFATLDGTRSLNRLRIPLPVARFPFPRPDSWPSFVIEDN